MSSVHGFVAGFRVGGLIISGWPAPKFRFHTRDVWLPLRPSRLCLCHIAHTSGRGRRTTLDLTTGGRPETSFKRIIMSALEQERIDRYLENLAGQLGDLPPRERRDELMRIRLRIERDLQELEKKATPPVEAAPRPPERAPARPAPAAVAVPARAVPAQRPAVGRPPLALSTRNVEWLGVCGGLAAYWGLDPTLVRLGAVTLGLLTGPFALLAYLAAYSALSVMTPSDAVPQPDGWKAIRAVASVTAGAVALFVVMQLVTWVLLRGHVVLMDPIAATLHHPWNWFAEAGRPLFFWTVLTAVPLALLGALPLPSQWNSTLAKLAHAVVALYGIVAAFGLACLFVGALMQVLPHLTGIGVGNGVGS